MAKVKPPDTEVAAPRTGVANFSEPPTAPRICTLYRQVAEYNPTVSRNFDYSSHCVLSVGLEL